MDEQLGTTADTGNALKALSRTDDELRVGNYLVVFNGRDLEGLGSANVNADGSLGEYFTAETDLESSYTKSGAVFVDWEHGTDDVPGRGDLLGVVDWKTARTDERGVWVERVLNRRSQYVQWLEGLIEMGLIGTSSEAVDSQVQKAADGQITRWPLHRDTLTVQPMEPRMMTENTIQALKALGIPVPDDMGETIALIDSNGDIYTSECTPGSIAPPGAIEFVTADKPQPEAPPEVAQAAVDAVKARLLRIRLKQLEEQ